MSIEERFEQRVDRSGGTEACHIWQGTTGQWGHPTMHFTKTKSMSVRRIAWKLAHGEEAPARRWVTPSCRNKLCMNPAHLVLRAVTDDETRFWSKVDKSAGPRACWPWRGRCNVPGYGIFSKGHHGNRQAHRYAWELTHGPIPDGLFVCHHCDNPPCCNPDHFFLGTAGDNHRDMERKGRMANGPKHAAACAAGLAKGRAAMAARRAGQPNGVADPKEK